MINLPHQLHRQSNRICLTILLSLSMLAISAKSTLAIPLAPLLKDISVLMINRLIDGNSNSQAQTVSEQYSQPQATTQYQQIPQYNNVPNHPVETYQPVPSYSGYPVQNSQPIYPNYPSTPYQPASPAPNYPPQNYPMNYQPYPNCPPATYAPNYQPAYPATPSPRPIMPVIINAF